MLFCINIFEFWRGKYESVQTQPTCVGLVDRVRSVRPIGWTVENMYFNVYVYNTITGNTTVIASMVAFSAITATLTTLFMGALSDKVGKRKIFICAGYIIWGFTTFAFSLITVHNTSVLFPAANAVMLAGVFVVIMDCVMTFFGSTANDAAFNAWITDVTEPQNRGKTETVLAIMPCSLWWSFLARLLR